MTSVYDSERLARAYAFDRPSVRLPFASGSFDLVTAAGSLNYSDVPSAFGEAARALTPAGTFLPYDFSPGRCAANGEDLATWFSLFEQRYPWPTGWQPFDVRELPLGRYGCTCSATPMPRPGCR